MIRNLRTSRFRLPLTLWLTRNRVFNALASSGLVAAGLEWLVNLYEFQFRPVYAIAGQYLRYGEFVASYALHFAFPPLIAIACTWLVWLRAKPAETKLELLFKLYLRAEQLRRKTVKNEPGDIKKAARLATLCEFYKEAVVNINSVKIDLDPSAPP
jgi:hypothetical protein